MKKLLFAILFLMGQISYAQSNFGFKGGLNLCKFTGSGVVAGASTLSAANIGLFDKIPLAKTTNIQIELSVSWEGENYNNYTGLGSYKFTYLNLPVLIHQKLSGGLFVETGPQVGLLLSAKVTNAGVATDFSSQVSVMDFGWDFGIGYKFSRMLALSARYNLGISNLGTPGTTSVAYRNSVLSFNIYFSLGKRRYK